jgi:hypothetical protein
MIYGALFMSADELANFITAPQLVEFEADGTQIGDSYIVNFTMDGIGEDAMRDRVREFGGVLLIPHPEEALAC